MRTEDYDIILKAMKFCKRVGSYASLLKLSLQDVELLENENDQFISVFSHEEHYDADAMDFIQKRVKAIHTRYFELVGNCRKSKDYTPAMGKELGLEPDMDTFNPHTAVPAIELDLEEGHPVL